MISVKSANAFPNSIGQRTSIGLQIAIFCAIGLSFVGCRRDTADSTAAGDQSRDRVVLMLNWFPEAEHGGFFAAQVHGIFERHGLDVTIQPGGPNAPVAQELLTGRVQFAIGNADDVLLFREQDAPVIALLAPIQNTPRCILVREESGISSLKELGNVRLQANAGRPFLDFMRQQGLLEGVQVVPYPGTVANFVADNNTAIQAYSFSEPLLAEQQGVKVRKLMLSDVGFNPYASCLIATEDYVAANSDLTERMVQACREGWIQYLQDPQLTNEAILAENKQGMSIAALEFGAQDLKGLCLSEEKPVAELGKMSDERWSELIRQFESLKLLTVGKVNAGQVFSNRYSDGPTVAN
ncbi:MAG: ABC transporter substrate-binding protein [Planctomycetales bacterium]|nr:ABC transporter substrate-binding protein [Planctomycetales bacterium]